MRSITHQLPDFLAERESKFATATDFINSHVNVMTQASTLGANVASHASTLEMAPHNTHLYQAVVTVRLTQLGLLAEGHARMNGEKTYLPDSNMQKRFRVCELQHTTTGTALVSSSDDLDELADGVR